MHRERVQWRAWVLAAALAMVPSSAWGQDGRGHGPEELAAQRTPEDQTLGDPLQIALLQPPPTPPAPGAAGETPPSDLAQRVEELEKRLARSAELEAAAKKQAASKPLVAPSGRLQLDVAGFSQDATSKSQFGDVPNAVGFRRARLALLGEAFDQLNYIVEMDFANRGVNSLINAKDQSTAFKEVYVQVRELPLLGNVRVGHFKECFGLEQLVSDNYTTFMERPIDDEGAFVPGRNNGIMAFNWTENERATWAIGTFTNQTGFDQPPTFQFDHWGLDLTMRATYLPWYDEPSGGRGLVHVGLDYAYRSAPDHTAVFAVRPEASFGPGIVNFTLPNVDASHVVGAETAMVFGPLCLQSEVFGMSVNRLDGTSNTFYGAYAYASYFLTGEGRPYNRKLGVFDRVRPFENFFRVRTGDGTIQTGRGAWELAYRFSYLDMLDDLTVKGAGRAADHTIGLNWYLNPYTKVMWNYVHSHDTYNVAAGHTLKDGNLDIFEMRCAIDF
jgi:phosphate-selective porin OprO/OprP